MTAAAPPPVVVPPREFEAVMNQYVGFLNVAWDRVPDDDLEAYVVTLVLPGRSKYRRYVHIVNTVTGMRATEIREGCALLRAIEAAKWRRTTGGDDAA
jgi:hypothetical protein